MSIKNASASISELLHSLAFTITDKVLQIGNMKQTKQKKEEEIAPTFAAASLSAFSSAAAEAWGVGRGSVSPILTQRVSIGPRVERSLEAQARLKLGGGCWTRIRTRPILHSVETHRAPIQRPKVLEHSRRKGNVAGRSG